MLRMRSPNQKRSPWYSRLAERWLAFLVPNTLNLFFRLWHRWPPCRGTLPPGPAVVVSNHPCHADAAFLMVGSGRWIHFLQAYSYYNVWWLAPFFRLFGCIPVKRGRPDPEGIRQALDHLRRGAVLGVFPEGDLTPPGGAGLHRGQTGAALLALRGGVPIVPAYIAGVSGTRGVAADWVCSARKVRVFLGPAIQLDAYRGQPITRARLRSLTDMVMQRIADLRPRDCGAAATSSPG